MIIFHKNKNNNLNYQLLRKKKNPEILTDKINRIRVNHNKMSN